MLLRLSRTHPDKQTSFPHRDASIFPGPDNNDKHIAHAFYDAHMHDHAHDDRGERGVQIIMYGIN